MVGAACYLGLIPFDPDTLHFDGIVRRHLEIMTGAGIVAGLVYWMIAGRNAGAWREAAAPAARRRRRCRRIPGRNRDRRHSGMVRRHRTQMRNSASGNRETAGFDALHRPE